MLKRPRRGITNGEDTIRTLRVCGNPACGRIFSKFVCQCYGAVNYCSRACLAAHYRVRFKGCAFVPSFGIERVRGYFQSHPGWHQAKDLLQSGVTLGRIYVYLRSLERAGEIESQRVPPRESSGRRPRTFRHKALIPSGSTL